MIKTEKVGTIYTLQFPKNDFEGITTLYNVFGIYFDPINEEEEKKVEKILNNYSWAGCEDRIIRLRLLDGTAGVRSHWFQCRVACHLEKGHGVKLTE